MAGIWNQPDITDRNEYVTAPGQSAGSDKVAEDNHLQGGTLMIPVKKTRTSKAPRSLAIGLAGTD
jgi:hypothetical protein